MGPTLISHYRLLDQLGEGGMGVVYRAEDIRLGREVAIKLLRAEAVQSGQWLGRFEREARLASSLQHPHICTIHELGEHEGQPFIAMERLEGRTIRQIVETGALPPYDLIKFAVQIADALDAAHRRGIIHRDIKPANLYVTYRDHLKVLDFGLAKMASNEPPPTETGVVPRPIPTLATHAAHDLTLTGDTVGTASYMSPEQALGHPLDGRTDLFSLGSVLYEMATVPPRTVNPAIPEALDAIIQRLLTVDVQRRYQTAAELLGDLKKAAEPFEKPAEAGSTAAHATVPPPRSARLRWAVPIAVAALVLAGVARITWFEPRASALTDRDSILIGTFDNATSDTMFDETLATALKVQLGQSPFLDIVTDQRIAETLRLMGRQPDERLTHAVALEACQRMGVKAMIEGSIAPLGTTYVMTLTATDCQSGETLAREQTESPSGERVLKDLGGISSSMRTTLGESLPSKRFDVPVEQATTPSLPALKAYALGMDHRRRGRELESIAFFNQAIEIDPEFASSYATLSTVYGSVGEWKRSEEFARLAYGLLNRVSERERLFIVYQYHDRVTGDQDKAAETLEMWKEAYPRDSRPSNALALIHHRLGRHERAVAEAREALRRSPGHPFPLSNLAIAYRALGKYGDARTVAEEAVKLGVETTPTRRLLYQLGTLAGDGSADSHLAWAKDRPREFDLVSAQAQVAAYEGRLREAGELYRRAADMALARGLKGTASGYAAHLAWTEALYRPGAQATESVRRVTELIDTSPDAPGTLPRFRAAAAYALAGLNAEAQSIVTHAQQRYPESTLVRTALVPSTRAALALRQGRANAAIEALEGARPTELGTIAALVPVYLRAEALLQKSAPRDAAREFERVLQHRGVDPFAPIVALAQLGVARARAAEGDTAASRRAYEQLFSTWKGADADFPPLLRARTEYAALSTPPGPSSAAAR
jgi:tetratricopeptide (TPR) repeat protein